MSRRVTFKLRLFVADNAPNSAQAIANLDAFRLTHAPDCCEIEIVDVFREPKRALADGIFMTPTLVVLSPLPVRRIVGTLSHAPTLLLALGVEVLAA